MKYVTVDPKTESSANCRKINQYFFVDSYFSIFFGFAVRANEVCTNLGLF